MNTTTKPSVIINLHDIHAAKLSAAASAAGKRVLFVSAVHPRMLLGALWEEEGFEGAWMENFRVIARLGKTVSVLEAPGLIMDDPTRWASWALEQLLAGKDPAALQEILDQSTEKTWAIAS
jgi:hypothetical protein